MHILLRGLALALGLFSKSEDLGKRLVTCVHIYIYRERERESDKYIYIYIYTYT